MDRQIRYVILKPLPAAGPREDRWRATVTLPDGQTVSAAGRTQATALERLAAVLAHASHLPSHARPHAPYRRAH